ncbi:hypothetical protein Dvina_28605 [Dactylosporangium vinaceum]|uniref:Uncharacterized protein n=1 Tax=Dactylosporangium vinaceum TaxID=53362 RepID=A0ABV5MN58_9ACTN|nr:hypothetical protein [Dactylosporangium vinaceum]UAB92331.1 hypothetical protein Dvina_28605 [Dactylosporangium vinaceum]
MRLLPAVPAADAVPAVAAVLMLAAGAGELAALAAARGRVEAGPTVGDVFDAAAAGYQVHRLAWLVTVLGAAGVVYGLRALPPWCWLLWTAVVVRIGFALATPAEALPGQQRFYSVSQAASATDRHQALQALDAIVPVAVDGLGIALLAAAVAGHLYAVRRRAQA